MIISPSILSIKEEQYLNIFKSLEENEITMIHLDVMDGKFVTNTTYDSNEVEKINKQTNLKLDVHLMINDPFNEISKYVFAGSDMITFHIEATSLIKETIDLIKSYQVKCGIAIKPNTMVETLNPYLKDLDLILVMSVEPGKGGQKFIDNSTEKIKYLKDLKEKYNYDYLISVDGGINDQTIKKVKEAGADMVVVGSYLMNSKNLNDTIGILKKI